MKEQITLILVVLALVTAAPCCADSADVSTPAAVGFVVTDVSVETPSTPTSTTLSFSNASLSAGYSLRFSIKADAPDFTRPAERGGAIPASKVTWVTTNSLYGTGYEGVLSSSSYTMVFQSNVNATDGSTEVNWTLAPIGSLVIAGDHTLAATWKIESL